MATNILPLMDKHTLYEADPNGGVWTVTYAFILIRGVARGAVHSVNVS